jgi:DNA-binding transcriptional LysR family regulator
MDQLAGELNDLKEGIFKHVRLCASSAAIAQFLPPLLANHASLHPQVRVELEEQVSEAVVTTLREGRCDVAVFVEGPDTTGLRAQIFRRDELVLVMPLTHDLACSKEPVSFIETLDEEWITLTAGAAMLQKQQQAALRANRPLKLRMQVRSFDAVCRLVASGLGIAILPKGACLPIIKAMKLAWRPIKDEWAERRLLVATASHESDTDTVCLVEILAKPSQNAKTKCHK